MTLAHWLWLAFALLVLLLGLAASRRAIAPTQPRSLALVLERPAEPLYRCARCGFLVAGDQHVDPYKGRRCR